MRRRATILTALCIALWSLLVTGVRAAPLVLEGEDVILQGTFVVAEGPDENERMVRYEAMKLDAPIDIRMEDGVREGIKLLKLWLDKVPAASFAANLGKRLEVSGKVYYVWHGRGSFVNPAKLQVTSIAALK